MIALDTNILIYCCDKSDSRRQQVALELVAKAVDGVLLWQVAYAEIYVTEHLWPEFRGRHLLEAIASYQKRERRYGGLIDNGGGN